MKFLKRMLMCFACATTLLASAMCALSGGKNIETQVMEEARTDVFEQHRDQREDRVFITLKQSNQERPVVFKNITFAVEEGQNLKVVEAGFQVVEVDAGGKVLSSAPYVQDTKRHETFHCAWDTKDGVKTITYTFDKSRKDWESRFLTFQELTIAVTKDATFSYLVEGMPSATWLVAKAEEPKKDQPKTPAEVSKKAEEPKKEKTSEAAEKPGGTEGKRNESEKTTSASAISVVKHDPADEKKTEKEKGAKTTTQPAEKPSTAKRTSPFAIPKGVDKEQVKAAAASLAELQKLLKLSAGQTLRVEETDPERGEGFSQVVKRAANEASTGVPAWLQLAVMPTLSGREYPVFGEKVAYLKVDDTASASAPSVLSDTEASQNFAQANNENARLTAENVQLKSNLKTVATELDAARTVVRELEAEQKQNRATLTAAMELLDVEKQGEIPQVIEKLKGDLNTASQRLVDKKGKVGEGDKDAEIDQQMIAGLNAKIADLEQWKEYLLYISGASVLLVVLLISYTRLKSRKLRRVQGTLSDIMNFPQLNAAKTPEDITTVLQIVLAKQAGVENMLFGQIKTAREQKEKTDHMEEKERAHELRVPQDRPVDEKAVRIGNKTTLEFSRNEFPIHEQTMFVTSDGKKPELYYMKCSLCGEKANGLVGKVCEHFYKTHPDLQIQAEEAYKMLPKLKSGNQAQNDNIPDIDEFLANARRLAAGDE
jgi:hypothetical protein